ncbi:SagB/ThcOx family dehydrogenase [Bacillus anthracis]|uniref:NADH oxidase n=1 Tax=Bacillus anthracis TaxID=1392 RepID=A0A2B0W5V7_BACAN|nr:SagB/ThcOx family dehydrogenase [Bacillus anthracis]PFL47216.1 NADH oxidase [Bacillus anthracis]
MIKVSENIVYFWRDGHLICDNYINHEQNSLSPIINPIIEFFSDWREKEEVYELISKNSHFTKEFLDTAIEQLITSNLLVEKDSERHKQELDLKHWSDWGTVSKYFHFSTRLLHTDSYLSKSEQYERLKIKKEICPPPPLYKTIPNSEKIWLPNPQLNGKGDFLEILTTRQTTRSFENEPISIEDFSTFLYLSYGIQSCKRNVGIDQLVFKTSPSAGCRHPIEVYPCVLNVQGIPNGLYHYSTQDHSLEIIKINNDMSDIVMDMAAGQNYVDSAAVVMFYTACLERSMWKYQSPRTYRVIMMDLGHLSQTSYLTANYLGLGAFFSGHLNDQLIEEMLDIRPSEEIVLGISGIGKKSKLAHTLGRDLRFIKEMQDEC